MNIFDKNNPNRIFYIMFVLMLALCIVCVSGLLILKSVKAQEPNAEETTKNNSTVNPDIQSSVILKQTADAGLAYQNKIIFVGDSNTHHLIISESLSDGKNTKQVWTDHDSGTLTLDERINDVKINCPQTGTKITIAEAAGIVKPEYMVITVGLNYIGSSGEKFINLYTNFVNSIKSNSPNTKIILQSIFPVTTEYSNTHTATNEVINTRNQWIIQVAANCGCKYLDTASVLKDSSGALINIYNTESGYYDDGYHIWKQGYTAVLNYIRTHAYID